MGQRKPDMVAFGQMRELVTPEEVVGHIPGIDIGSQFRGKGEVAIVGLHCNINSGIYFKYAHPGFSAFFRINLFFHSRSRHSVHCCPAV